MILVAFERSVPELGTGPLFIPLIAFAGWRLGAREATGVTLVAALLDFYPQSVDEPGMLSLTSTVRAVVRLATYAIVAVTVCGLRRAYDRERYAARHDELTGVLNRAAFEAHTRTILEASGPNGRVTVLALADIDGFKSVNDTAGHAAGDDILREFAALGTSAIGHGERLGRLGGDEFILLLQAGTVTAAMVRVEALHRYLRDGLRTTGQPVGISLGALIVPSGTSLDWTAALGEADRLMYVAKRARKGGFRVRTFGMRAGASPLAAA